VLSVNEAHRYVVLLALKTSKGSRRLLSLMAWVALYVTETRISSPTREVREQEPKRLPYYPAGFLVAELTSHDKMSLSTRDKKLVCLTPSADVLGSSLSATNHEADGSGEKVAKMIVMRGMYAIPSPVAL